MFPFVERLFPLVMTVGITTSEQSFSKMKLIQTYLRSTIIIMGQEGLSLLALISIERVAVHDVFAKDIEICR